MSFIARVLVIGSSLVVSTSALASTAVDELLASYRQQGASGFSAAAGKSFWNQSVSRNGIDRTRSCATCHTSDVHQYGKHAITGNEIEPLAHSVMSKRLTNPRKIRKWLRRNCEWVRGRECTPQEKGDILTYLREQ